MKGNPENLANLLKTLMPFLLKEKQLEIKKKKIMVFFNILCMLLMTAIGLVVHLREGNSISISVVAIITIILSLIACYIIFK